MLQKTILKAVKKLKRVSVQYLVGRASQLALVNIDAITSAKCCPPSFP